jgi:hypothetical protein
MSGRAAFWTAVAAIVLLAQPLAAQDGDGGFRLAFAAGPTINDLETGGVDWMYVAGGEWRAETWPVVITADVRYLTYELADRRHIVLPEIGFQLGARLGILAPFVDLGGGIVHTRRSGEGSTDFSAHAGLGMRIRLSSAIDLRLEARGRSADPLIDFTAGLAIGL